jgi:hypothetical protein
MKMEAASTGRRGGLGEPSGGGPTPRVSTAEDWRGRGRGRGRLAAWRRNSGRRRGRETAVRRSSASASSRRWDGAAGERKESDDGRGKKGDLGRRESSRGGRVGRRDGTAPYTEASPALEKYPCTRHVGLRPFRPTRRERVNVPLGNISGISSSLLVTEVWRASWPQRKTRRVGSVRAALHRKKEDPSHRQTDPTLAWGPAAAADLQNPICETCKACADDGTGRA